MILRFGRVFVVLEWLFKNVGVLNWEMALVLILGQIPEYQIYFNPRGKPCVDRSNIQKMFDFKNHNTND